MSILRYVTVSAAGGTLAFALLFACATNIEVGEPDAPQPDTGPGTMIPEAAAADSEAAVDGPVDAGFDGIVTGACSAGGFCFQPVPIQAPLTAVSGSSANDVWAVGGSSILRHRSTDWEQVYEYSGTTPASLTFFGIWARAPENVWAVAKDNNGRLVFVRYTALDGGAPSFHEIPTTATATGVWVTPSADAAWIANGSGTLTRLHDDGNSGVTDSLVPTAFPGETKPYYWSSVWGFASDDVYVAGVDYSMFGGATGPRSPPMVAHYDGTSWTITTLALPGGMGADSLSGTPPAGPQRLWLSTAESGTGGPVYGVVAYPIEDGGIGNALLTQKVTAQSPCGSKYVSAVSPAAAWMSNGKAVCRWNGTELEAFSTSLGGLPTGLVRGVWAPSEDEVWVVGEAVPQGVGFPTTGFAARRTKDAGAPQP